MMKSLSNLNLPTVTTTRTLARRELSPRSARDESLTVPSRTHSIPNTVGGAGSRVPALDTTALSQTEAGGDAFQRGGSTSATAGTRLPRGGGAGGTPAGFTPPGPPTIPGRSHVSELNPFDASTLPTRGKGNGLAAELGAGVDHAAGVPIAPDQAARLAAMRAEQDASIGHATGPDHGPSVTDVAVNWDTVHGAMAAGAAIGAAEGVITGMAATGATLGTGAPSIPLLAAGGAAKGALLGGAGALLTELYSDYQNEKREAEKKAKKDKDKSASTDKTSANKKKTPEKPPAGVPPEPKPAPASESADAADAGKKTGLDPMLHGSGRNYEAWRGAYLGHADGTPFGARGTSTARSGADPRKTNPGRDQVDTPRGDGPRVAPSLLGLTQPVDPMRSGEADARGAQLASMSRVTGRVIITDPDADTSTQPGAKTPKGNGLVR